MHFKFKSTALAVGLLQFPLYAATDRVNEQHHEHDDHHHEHHEHQQEFEKIQVRASRLARIVTESATKIEVINGEEIQEKALMRPGNISMLVAETGGVRVQTTSPALGSANIRLQGLYGRYTQLLSDGLPLYGGQTTSIGLLQIPPTDLANVEIIKGAASSLYGSSALGGVINLISRTPKDEFEGEVLLNLTSKDGQDLTSYIAAPLTDKLSGSVTLGAHHQHRQDLDDDGWADMAGYERGTVRPRLYWQGEDGANLYLTLGLMNEDRQSGTINTIDSHLSSNENSTNAFVFPQNQDTIRQDMGFIYDQPLAETLSLNLKGAASSQKHDHLFGEQVEIDRHRSYLIESSVSGYTDEVAWLVGAAYQREEFDGQTFPEFDYSFSVPGVFSQLDYEFKQDLFLSLSARSDWHSEYGTQFNPRFSVLYSPNDWTIRGAYGKGYFAPTPFVEEIDDAGLSHLAPLGSLEEERATTGSLDISYVSGKLESSVTLFASDVDNVTQLESIEGQAQGAKSVRLVNSDAQSQIRGAELLMRYRWRDIKFTGSYLYTDATEVDSSQSSRVPLTLTPRHSAGLVIMWEQHGSHLLGFEAYYTGTQHLENTPYRQRGSAYWHLGLLGQITLGRVSWFVNAENLLNVRQTKDERLLLPQQGPSGRWTTDIWSRNDGFTVNAGVRISFGGH